MMKTLVIAEKPSVGKDIARVLGCKNSKNGFIEGGKYVVTWAMGHLVTLADPEKYDDKYKSWNLSDLPIMPKKAELVVIKQTSKQFGVVKTLIHRKDISEVVIATDAGREGELVARWCLLKAGNKKPLKRLWISSVTDKAIKEGFLKLKNGKEYDNLYYSAVSRAEADWLVGINATRALTSKFNAQLSCGRVQTPTLSIIFKREEDIKNFKPAQYFGFEILHSGIKFTWTEAKSGDIKTFDREKRDFAIQNVKNKKGKIISVEKNVKKAYSPLLYDLTELQRDANKRFGFSAKETLSIMQTLYERHKVLTYPRTDSRYLTEDIVETIPERLSALPKEYFKFKNVLLKTKIKGNSNFVNNKKVSDHHAIIPTEQPVYYDEFTDREKKIYDMVVKRFLCVLYPPFEYEQISVKCDIGGELFFAKGRKVLKKGYKEVYDYEDDEEEKIQNLPDFTKGQEILADKVNLTSGSTKPPARFTEATLLSAMENPAKYMENNDKLLSKTLGETGGLGTVATRADIIEKLFSSYLIEKRVNDIFITSKGKQLLGLVPKDLKSPEMTALWELKLGKIAKGGLDKNSFMEEIREYTRRIIGEIKSSDAVFKHDNMSTTKCPECGKLMLEVKGKKGKMLVCQDRECGYKKSVSVVTNARCPECHKKLELVGEGDGKRFVCACGYRERYSVFQERKKAEGNKMDKRNVQKFLKNLNKDTEINNPMKDILNQLKETMK
ncbi:MAG: DNA topoisomerase III [Clostridiales bacterium]|nr:DNA topoisomerase III [Clostridiales bacterium]